MPLSDSSKTCTRAVRPSPFPAVRPPDAAAGVPEVSRFSCRKCLGVSGVYDYAGLLGDSRWRPRHMLPSAWSDSVGVPIARFRSSIPSPPIPLFTLHYAPHGTQRKTRGRVVRYSFLVRIFHPLLPAGLSRRTRPPSLRSASLNCECAVVVKAGREDRREFSPGR